MSLPEFKKLILSRMHSVLGPHGFRKRGSTFAAERGDVVLLVQLQSSAASTRDRLKATVNLGVFSRTLDALRGPRRGEPTEADAHWRQRIGYFRDEPRDHWWRVSSHEEAFGAAEEIARLLQDRALPALDGLASTQALQKLWATGQSPGLTEFQRKELLSKLEASEHLPA